MNHVDPITAPPHLRLVWPQWQGAGTESVRSLAPEFPFDIARRGYSVGTKVLQAVLPQHDDPTAIVPVEMGDIGLEVRDGIEAKAVVLQQLRSALAIIQEHEPARITTVGGRLSHREPWLLASLRAPAGGSAFEGGCQIRVME